MKLKWYGVLFISILSVVAFCGAADTPQSHGQLYEKWLAEARARDAKRSPQPGPPQQVTNKDQLQSPTTACIVEINARISTQVSCTVPSGAGYFYSELFLKNGLDGSQGFNWKPCDYLVPPDSALCPGANGSWYLDWPPLPEEGGQYGLQRTLVPFTSCHGPCDVRGRVIVTFGKLKSSMEKQKP